MLSATLTINRRSVQLDSGVNAIEVRLGNLYAGEIYENWDGQWGLTNLTLDRRYYPNQLDAENALVEVLRETIRCEAAAPELREFYRRQVAA